MVKRKSQRALEDQCRVSCRDVLTIIALSIRIVLWLYFMQFQQKDLKNISSDKVFHGDQSKVFYVVIRRKYLRKTEKLEFRI